MSKREIIEISDDSDSFSPVIVRTRKKRRGKAKGDREYDEQLARALRESQLAAARTEEPRHSDRRDPYSVSMPRPRQESHKRRRRQTTSRGDSRYGASVPVPVYDPRRHAQNRVAQHRSNGDDDLALAVQMSLAEQQQFAAPAAPATPKGDIEAAIEESLREQRRYERRQQDDEYEQALKQDELREVAESPAAAANNEDASSPQYKETPPSLRKARSMMIGEEPPECESVMQVTLRAAGKQHKRRFFLDDTFDQVRLWAHECTREERWDELELLQLPADVFGPAIDRLELKDIFNSKRVLLLAREGGEEDD